MSGYIREVSDVNSELLIEEAYFLFKKGIEHSENGESEKAIQFFYIAFTRWNDPRLFFYIAREYEKLRNYSQAIFSYYKVIEGKESVPQNILQDTYINLSILLIETKKDISQADKFIHKAYVLMQETKAYPYIAEKLLEKKSKVLLERFISRWIEDEPKNHKPYTYLGFLAMDEKKYEKAEKLFLKSIELYPNNRYKNYLKSLDFYKVKQSHGNIKQKIKLLLDKKNKNYKDLLQIGLLYMFDEQYEMATTKLVEAKKFFLQEQKKDINENSSFSVEYNRRES